jgi:periplasmic divalent cation tolerance protein
MSPPADGRSRMEEKGMEEMVTIVTTGRDRDLLRDIAKGLLEKHLIACSQIIGPLESHYWWKGEIREAAEWMVLMKTRRTLYDAVERIIADLHHYEVPEIVALPIVRCLPAYGKWIEDETAGGLGRP